jgi:hypothetical protein
MIQRYKARKIEPSSQLVLMEKEVSGQWVKYGDHQKAVQEAYEKGKAEERTRALTEKWGKEKY